ncbi:MAG: hypothetical protein NZ602_14885 [Thermoguttaceae bacterium]|nr:hypothetical protein [Thermoguttaceae bacterium]MDW8036990.1 hypothetical protein [Thermoguttaceae bacterium]
MAPPVRRQIRPVRVIPFEDVEDQLWPINLLVVILAGFVVGLILGLSRFDDPRPLYNAYFQLFTVGLTLAIWFVAVRWIRGRLKQRLKIAALFSLVAHLWLLLSLGVGYYRLILQAKVDRDKVEEIAELRVPDYPDSVMESEDFTSPYHRPVETPLPALQTPEVPKQPLETSVPTVEKPSVPMPKRPEPQPVPPLPVERREIGPPHRAESFQEPIRRQITEVRQEPVAWLPLPEIRPAAPPKGPEAPVELVQRQPTQGPQPQRVQPHIPHVQRPAPAPAATRREVQSLVPSPSLEVGGPSRPVRPAPDLVVQAEAPPPQAAAKPKETTFVYQPREIRVPRQHPLLGGDRKLADLVPETPFQPPARSAVVPRALEEPIRIVQTSERLPVRQASDVFQASVPEEPLPQLSASPEVRRSIGPAPTPLTRRQPSIGHLADRARQPEVQTPLGSPTGEAAVGPTRRPQDSALRGGALSGEPVDQRPARTVQPLHFEPVAEPIPFRPADSVVSGGSALPLGQADAVAVQPEARSKALPGHRTAQALAGTLQPVTGPGLPEPAPAARRVQASQRGEEGFLEPSTPVGFLPRRQTGTPIPTAGIPQEEASLAGAVGSAQSSAGEQIAPGEAGSQTTVRRQAPGAPIGQSSRGSISISPLLGTASAGAVTRPAKPPEGGEVGSLGHRLDLSRSNREPARWSNLDGRVSEATGALAGTGQPGPQSAQTGTGQPDGGLQPGAVSVSRTQAGTGLPGSKAAREVLAWQLPAGEGTVVLEAVRRSGAGWENRIIGSLEGGLPGPSRQMGRLPSLELEGKVPEIGTGSAEGQLATKGGAPSGGSVNTPMEPVLPGAERPGVGNPAAFISGFAPGRPEPGYHLGQQTLSAKDGPAVGAATSLAKKPSRESGPTGLENALAAMALPRAARVELPGIGSDTIPTLGGSGDQPGSKTEGRGAPTGTGSQTGTTQGITGSLGGQWIEIGRQAAGLPVHMIAQPGVGGVSPVPSSGFGIPTRRAHPQSEQVHLAPGRFLLERSGSRLAIDARAEPAEAFRQRHPSRRGRQAQQYGGSEASEQAVERGLAFLAKLQWPDGRWRFHAIPEALETWPGQTQARHQPQLLVQMAGKLLQEPSRLEHVPEIKHRWNSLQRLLEQHSLGQLDQAGWKQLEELVREMVFFPGVKQSDSAATGLALLAFLGAGYTHQEGPYRAEVQRGLTWLLANQKPDGDLWGYTQGSATTWLYSHAIAAIALCEAYGMTKEERLRGPAERAIQFIVASQHPTRGGWRYQPREDSDTSVSGWMLMALKSAQMAGLQVPQPSLDLVSRWLDLAKAPGGDGSRYVYNPFSQETASEFWFHRTPTASMTAEALLMRMYLGWNREHPLLQRGADFLQANPPEPGSVDRPTRDAYYWYYASQVMFQMAGKYWENWNGKLRPYLESSQIQEGPLAGSWDPVRPVPDRFAHEGGRLYVTALHLLILEVYYRHLPLFRTLREELNQSGVASSTANESK